ncbi:PorT family protein [Dysgonomonas sp. Marseille-P4677]|uniref:porin family protein n=1 Tax=Dysgonomonas sp. Marseille-P4677 TaxID=2364790 RepID=UPI0019134C0F|nr:porin family protein [Dysgonomonas sp. Marseille-P4677]MBK5722734.1 PorT family protein [Dysgonomonas sp. Marseille-P4677]
MKQTSRIVFISMFLLVCMLSKAQERKLYFGVKAGFMFSDMSGYPSDTKIKHAFTGGLTFDYFINSDLYLSSALEYANKGNKFDHVDESYVEAIVTFKKSTVAAMYLQMPIHVGYKFDINKSTRLMIQGGPYIAYGLGGQTELGNDVIIQTQAGTTTTTLADYMASTNSWRRGEETFSEARLREFDWGIGLGLTLEYEHVNVGLRYDHGLYDIARWEKAVRNRAGYITFGYKF